MCKKVSPLSPLLRFHSGFENPQQKRCLFSGLYLTPPPPQGLEVRDLFKNKTRTFFVVEIFENNERKKSRT